MAALLLFFYAATLLGGGAWAYMNAPAGANATTALAVPGFMALLVVVAALMAMQIKVRRFLGSMGVMLGLGLAAVFAIVTLVQGTSIAGQVGNYNDALKKFDEQQAAAAAAPGFAPMAGKELDAARLAFLESAKAPSHDKTYLRNTLLALCGVSVLAAGGLFLLRPRKQPKTA